MRLVLAAALVSLSSVAPATVHAAPLTPNAFIGQQMDVLNAILGKERSTQLPALRKAFQDVLDFGGFTEKALAEHYAKLTPKQRLGVRDALQELVESRYLVGDAKPFDKSKVVLGANRRTGDQVEVDGLVKQKEVDVHFTVKMQALGDRYRVWDVIIDGTSLLGDYRSQFATFLKKKTPDELIARLHSRAEGYKKPKTASAAPTKP